MKILQLTILLLLIVIVPIKSQELGYINDSDGYTNFRYDSSGKSDIIGIVTTGQEFKYFPDKNSEWWKIDFEFRTGYMHKSRIKSFNTVKSEISTYFQEYYSADKSNVELSEGYNEKLFMVTQNYPLATLTAFCELSKEVQFFLISIYESPLHDLIDLQLIYSRLISIKSSCSESYKITDALKIAASHIGLELLNKLLFNSNITDYNRPDKHPTISNKWFVSQLKGETITYYLNHPEIDTFAKMFYQGQFAVSDDTLTFAFLDSVLTSNTETKAFYLHIFNSVLSITDGALSESIGSECRAYLEKYPCDFINIKDHSLYADNYQKWIGFTAFEYSFEQDPISAINNNIELIKPYVHSECASQIRELETIRTKLIAFVKDDE